MRVLTFLLLVVVSFVLAERKLYDGYRLLRIVAANAQNVETLKKLEADFTEIDFWTEPHVNRPCDMNVPPELVEYVSSVLRSHGMLFETIHRDLQKLINRHSATPLEKLSGDSQADDIVSTFPRHAAVEAWLENMAERHSPNAEIVDIGTTYEGRIQRMIKVGVPNTNGTPKPIIWVDSAIHAREWLTVGTTIWIINKMLTTYNTDTKVKDLMDHYDWYFLPVANPDGYEYTHTTDRLWRKTRGPTIWYQCPGADPNRNWDFQWGVDGTSTSPCAQTYGGDGPFSEKCTQNMRDAILSFSPHIKLYIGLHSYSQLLLTPFAADIAKPNDYEQLLRVANAGNTALKAVHGRTFQIGTPPDILYAASGGAYDWAKAVAGIKYAYTYELRPDGNAWNGFVVSESEIQPSGEEVWASLAKVAENIK